MTLCWGIRYQKYQACLLLMWIIGWHTTTTTALLGLVSSSVSQLQQRRHYLSQHRQGNYHHQHPHRRQYTTTVVGSASLPWSWQGHVSTITAAIIDPPSSTLTTRATSSSRERSSSSSWTMSTQTVVNERSSPASTTTTTRARTLPLLQQQLSPPGTHIRVRIYWLRHGETDWNQRGLIQGGGHDIPLNAAGQCQARLAAHQLHGLPITLTVSSHLQRSRQTADLVAKELLQYNDDSSIDNNNNNNNKNINSSMPRLVLPALGEMRFGAYEGMAVRGRGAIATNRATLVAEHFAQMQRNRNLPWPTSSSLLSSSLLSSALDKLNMNDDVTEQGDGVAESYNDVVRRGHEALEYIFRELGLAYPHPISSLLNTMNGNSDDDTNDSSAAPSTSFVTTPSCHHVCLVAHGRFNKIVLSELLQLSQIPEQGNTCINVLDWDDQLQRWTCPVLNFIQHVQQHKSNASNNDTTNSPS